MATGKQTEFTVSAKDKTKAALKSAQKNLKSTGKEADKLAGRFRNVARATVIMEGPLGGTAGRLSAMATMLNSVGLGTIAFGVGLTGLTAIAAQSMKRFADFEKQTFKIEQLLKQTGNASGLTGDQIEEMSLQIGRSTLASADDVRAASAVLLTFKSVAGDAFGRTMAVASDLAALTGQDLKQSVIQLGKALEDPATGMSALRRSGVSFTNSQKDMIVKMKKTGDVAGAQAEILALLEGQLGGAGAAAGGGLAGAADLVAENWNNMLIKMAESGAGQTATEMLTGLGNVLQWVGHLIDPDDAIRLIEIRQEMAAINKETNEMVDRGGNSSAFMGSQGAKLRLLRQEREEITARQAEQKKASEEAIADSKKAQAEIQKQQAQELVYEQKKKDIKLAQKEADKESKEGSGYAQKIIDEQAKFTTSLLEKSTQEDQFYAERLVKLQEYHAAGAITEQEAEASGLAAKQLYEAKITEIKKTEKEKQMDAEQKLQEMQVAATQTALTDIGTLMAASSKRLFKLGQAAAVANALVNTYQAVTKTMASVPYPFNIPLAVAQGLAGMVQVQKIKQQKMSAKEHGGSVIGGRSYLVGERGPELFTPPRTGQIINNSTTNAVGGQSNNISVTVVNDVGEEFVERNAVKIWDSIVDKMNEEGLRFA